MNFQKIFVTVGTTEFDNLIIKLIYEEDILKSLNCKTLRCQYGTGRIFNEKKEIYVSGIDIETFSLKSKGIQDDIQWADLVISHAGYIKQHNFLI